MPAARTSQAVLVAPRRRLLTSWTLRWLTTSAVLRTAPPTALPSLLLLLQLLQIPQWLMRSCEWVARCDQLFFILGQISFYDRLKSPNGGRW